MKSDAQRRFIHQIADRAIPDDYDDWPVIRRRLASASATARQTKLAWRWAVVAVVTVAALFAGATLLATGTPETVSADTLVDRAGAISAGLAGTVRSYHIKATTTLHPRDSSVAPIVQEEETWFDGPGRTRQETSTSDWSTVTVTNGSQTWWSVARGGHTYAAPAAGIRFSDTALLNPLAPEGTNIASVLEFLSQKGCGTFRREPDQTVVGRDAYVVSATHTLQSMLDHMYGCGNPVQLLTAPSPSPSLEPVPEATLAARAAEKRAALATQQPAKVPPQVVASPSPLPAKPENNPAPSEVQRLLSTTVVDTFWIDKQTFVPLKAEQNLGPKGTSQYQVTRVEFDVALPESTFQFTPPSSAEVLQDPAAIKQILASR